MAIFSLLAGWEGVYAAGVLGDADIGSVVQLIIDDEFAGMLNHLLKGIEVNSETLAIKTIQNMGIGGNFLASEHTRRNFAELWRPDLGVGGSNDNETMAESAKKKAKAMLKENHSRSQLKKDQVQEIKRIVKQADREIGSKTQP